MSPAGPDDQVRAPGAVLVGALAVAAAFGSVVRGDAHRGEVPPRRVADEDDVAAVAAVAAVGPATGTCASRRKLTTPSPPRPPSTNMRRAVVEHGSEPLARYVRATPGFGYRDDAALATGRELDLAGAGGEDRVVAAEPDPVARMEPGAALADDDLAAPDALAGEDLDAEDFGWNRGRCGSSRAPSCEPSVGLLLLGGRLLRRRLLRRRLLGGGLLRRGPSSRQRASWRRASWPGPSSRQPASRRPGLSSVSAFFAAGLRVSIFTSVTSRRVSSERWP